MALPKQENFSTLSAAADLTTVTGWTFGIGDLRGQTGGGIVGTFSTGNSIYWWGGDTFSSDQYAQMVITTAPGGSAFMGVALRATSASAYYVMISPDVNATGYIGVLTNNLATDTDLRHFSCPAANTTLRLEVSGSTFTLKG